MRLTIDLLRYANSYLNAIGQREINLRKYAIPAIENLGILNDGYDTIDLSENSIVILENFPIMKRLNTLLLHNNKIRRIAKGLGKCLVNLENLMVTNNQILDLSDLDGIEELKSLERVSLLGNPVTKARGYRLWVIWRLPNLKYLDFKKIKQCERIEAEKIFGKDSETKGSRESKESRESRHKSKDSKQKHSSSHSNSHKHSKKDSKTKHKQSENEKSPKSKKSSDKDSQYMQLNSQQKNTIVNLIQNAKSVDEVNQLEEILKSGKIPAKDWQTIFANH